MCTHTHCWEPHPSLILLFSSALLLPFSLVLPSRAAKLSSEKLNNHKTFQLADRLHFFNPKGWGYNRNGRTQQQHVNTLYFKLCLFACTLGESGLEGCRYDTLHLKRSVLIQQLLLCGCSWVRLRLLFLTTGSLTKRQTKIISFHRVNVTYSCNYAQRRQSSPPNTGPVCTSSVYLHKLFFIAQSKDKYWLKNHFTKKWQIHVHPMLLAFKARLLELCNSSKLDFWCLNPAKLDRKAQIQAAERLYADRYTCGCGGGVGVAGGYFYFSKFNTAT